MPRALPNETRRDIVRRHLNGQPLPQIASELQLSQDTVRALWRAFRDHGEAGLALRYHACGQATPSTPEPILDAACQLKHDHPTWGAGRIRLELLRDFASAQIPSPRVLQRAFQRAGVNRPRRSQRPKTSLVRALAPHEVWQVDAVEKARLATGEEVSWMTVTDEFSGALLASELSPQPQWQAIVPGDARELFRHGFGRWGLPGGIRIDNGHPWGLNSGLPPDLA